MKTRLAFMGIKGLPSKSGTERVIEAVAIRLVDKMDVTVYCDAKYTPAGTDYPGIHLVRIPAFKGKYLRPILLDLLSAFHALFFGRYDIVHVNGIDNSFIIPLLKLRFRVVATSHGNPSRLPTDKWSKGDWALIRTFEYPFLYLSDCPTAISAPDRDDFFKRYHKKVVYIPNGVEVDPPVDLEGARQFIQGMGLVPNGFLLFIAGRIIERKGCHILLEALNKGNINLPVLIIGDLGQISDYGNKLRQLAEGHPVRFVPPIDDKSLLFGVLKLCKLFIFPSTGEGMSMMFLEAASLGAPMICSDIPENSMLDGYVTCFRSGNAEDLASQISWALKNEAEVTRLGNNVKQFVKDNYSWDAIAAQYVNLYQTLDRHSREKT